jgi:hypothetical protein
MLGDNSRRVTCPLVALAIYDQPSFSYGAIVVLAQVDR